MTLNLAVLLEESTEKHPEKPALILGNRVLDYAGLRAAAKKFANALVSMGVEPGDKVAIMLPNVPEYVISYYGILNAGAVAVPLNGLLQGPEVTHHLDDSDAVAFVVWEDFLETARKGYEDAENCKNLIVAESPDGEGLPEGVSSFEELLAEQEAEFDVAPTMPDDTAVVIYTSGTTGRPKGAELSHFNLFFNAVYKADKLLKLREDDVGMAVLPALSYIRPVYRNERRHLLRQHHRHGPALRAGSGAQNDTEQQCNHLCRGPHDVSIPIAPPRRERLRHLVTANRHLRRRLDARGGAK